MSDERGRGAADDGRPGDAGEPASDAQEPEFGSSEWLLQQLTGGRRVGRRSAERDDEAGRAESAEEPTAVQDAAPASEEIPPVASGDAAANEPAAFDELLGSAVAPEAPPAAAAEPGPEPQTEFPVAFNWNLTPGEGVDPLVEPEPGPEPEVASSVDVPAAPNPEPVHDDAAEAQAAAWASFQSSEAAAEPTAKPEAEQPRADQEAEQPAWSLFDALVAEGPAQGAEAPEEPVAPASPVAPEPEPEPEPAAAPEYRSPLFEPTPAEEPEPPTAETPVAAGSWVIPPAEPPQPAEPVPPRTIFDPPAAASTPPTDADADERGHGLAALLGFGAPEEGEQSARSVIGDTTSIIPLVPGAVPPAPATPATPPASGPAATEPPSTEWAGSHQPDPWLDRPGHADPAPPTNPVLPPIDAAALFEPATDTAAHRAAAPELDALLRSESRPEPPTLPAEHSLPSEPETVLPPTAGTEPEPFAPTAAFPAVLPSEPEIPAAEAEIALGGVPSPATSPIDAASIAAAAETAAFESPAAAEETPDGDESDGLAELFGDVATIDDAPTYDAPTYDAETDDAPTDHAPIETDSAGTDDEPAAPARDEALDEAEQEPAAALEGPQLTATVPFFLPSPDTLGPTEEADGIDDAAATGGPAAGAAASPAPAAAQTSTPVTASTSPSAAAGPTAAPAGPGLWGSRNNRILFSVAGGLAVLLVLIGLFALGTRIPSLFGAAKPVPAPTASAASATPKPTPTPTPVPTVTPKPAPVGAGTHPWDALGGGECIQPFTTVWAQEFTVVDCATPHTAQLVYTNLLSADPAAPYPGADALAGQVPGLCTASGVVDLNAAGAYPDLQVIGSFPATEQQWKDGQRSYYCFVNRSGGEPLTTSVAGPGPTG
ncbi:hypothetical protein [Leifsonia virtsii]|uniref:Septum formation-related domain-containing protein n=1 Tax=Leifsonia virtsii TaxID=3035915 RepID=A0ABT8IVT9_9MICO|nr:hypothetical protein [Leifsonia virtsii]MDN4596929.1 hypothetical protein [Leifsonia virtsii]